MKDFDIERISKINHNSAEFHDFCFMLMNTYGNDVKELKKYAEMLGVTVSDIKKIAKYYHEKDKELDYQMPGNAIRKRKLYITSGYDKINGELTEKVLKAEDEKVIINLLKAENKTPDDLYAKMSGYVKNMYPDNSDKLLDILAKKVNIYRNYSNKAYKEAIQKEKIQFDATRRIEALSLAKEILEHDNKTISLKQIPKVYHIGAGIYLSIREAWIKENVFEHIVNKLKANRTNRMHEYKDIISKLLPLASDNMIPVGNKFRKIDIIDCYTYFGDDFEVIQEICDDGIEINGETLEQTKKLHKELGVIKGLLKQKFPNLNKKLDITYNISSDLEDSVIEKFLREKREIDFQKFDKDGFPIAGSGYELTVEDKKMMVDIMRNYNIPITSGTFDTMVKHFHNGKIELITPDNIDEYLSEIKDNKTK